MYFSELLELNYKKYIKYKDIFSHRIDYTEQEIDKLTNEIHVGNRKSVLKGKMRYIDFIKNIGLEAENNEKERLALIPKCLEVIDDMKVNYLDLWILEKYQLEEIYNHYANK